MYGKQSRKPSESGKCESLIGRWNVNWMENVLHQQYVVLVAFSKCYSIRLWLRPLEGDVYRLVICLRRLQPSRLLLRRAVHRTTFTIVRPHVTQSTADPRLWTQLPASFCVGSTSGNAINSILLRHRVSSQFSSFEIPSTSSLQCYELLGFAWWRDDISARNLDAASIQLPSLSHSLHQRSRKLRNKIAFRSKIENRMPFDCKSQTRSTRKPRAHSNS